MQIKRTNFAHGRFRGRSLVDTQNLVRTLRKEYLLVFLALIFLCGEIFGSVFSKTADFSLLGKLDFIFYSDFTRRASQSLGSIFVASLASTFLFVLCCFLCGLSAWGLFFIPFIPFFRGFGVGVTAGYLYAAYGFEGVLFHAVIILPGAFICVLSILYAAKEGIQISKRIASQCFFAQKSGGDLKIHAYLSRYGMIIVLAVLSAVLDIIMTACFSGAFSFLE